MAIWKDKQGKFHDDMDGEAIHLLPEGCVISSQAEVGAANAPTQPDKLKAIERAIEAHMDAVAKMHTWDSRWTCTARAGYANPWQAEAIKFAQWMDACWAYTIQEQAKIAAGTRTMPMPEQAIAELPVMVW